MIVDCNKMWTQLVSAVYLVRRRPMVATTPPSVEGPTPAAHRQRNIRPPTEPSTAEESL